MGGCIHQIPWQIIAHVFQPQPQPVTEGSFERKACCIWVHGQCMGESSTAGGGFNRCLLFSILPAIMIRIESRIFGRWHNRESAMIAYVGVQCFANNQSSSHQFHNPWTLQKGLKASKYAQSNKSICCKCTHADSQRAFSTGPYLKKTVPKWLTVNKSWPGHVSLP